VTDSDVLANGFDPSRPNVARVYDYLLEGKNHFAADRAIGDHLMAAVPGVETGVRAQRAVLGRVVRYLVSEIGIRQLLDVGSGLPTADNVHEIARRADPSTRVVYVDNDPVVLAHATALLADDTSTFAVKGDLFDPASITENPAVRAHLDWGQPIGLLLCGIIHYVLDSDGPTEIIGALVDALPSGSYVFIHHLLDNGDPASAELQASMARGLGRVKFRTMAQVRALFGGLELVPPGIVQVPAWRPDPGTPPRADYGPVLELACAGVARKPLLASPQRRRVAEGDRESLGDRALAGAVGRHDDVDDPRGAGDLPGAAGLEVEREAGPADTRGRDRNRELIPPAQPGPPVDLRVH
jgi:hypothetical protein